jgi:hypothetical protein
LALAGTLVIPTHHLDVDLAATAMVAAAGWLLEALVGHAHKVVPFMAWSLLRSAGARTEPAGKRPVFTDLYGRGWAATAYGTVTGEIRALCGGLVASCALGTAAGGALLAANGAMAAANLSLRPLHPRRACTREDRTTSPTSASAAARAHVHESIERVDYRMG